MTFPGPVPWPVLAGVCLWFGLGLGGVQAHDGPENVIEDLTARLARQGPSPDLFFRRAAEYRVLGRLPLAEADLRSALALEPTMVRAWAELSRICLAQGNHLQALDAIRAALAQASEPSKASPLHIIRAQIQLARGDAASALRDCESALRSRPGKVDWYLIRCQAQRALGRLDAAAQGLEEGFRATGSFVLEQEQIEALIDAGDHRRALELITPHLAASRWKSSWLLRRARARLESGQPEAAQADLEAALEEIHRRFNPNRPDLTLMVDRGLAQALLGRRQAAEADLRTAQELGAEDWLVWRLRRVLEQMPKEISR